jgi:alkaline phosphatase D
MAPAQPTTPSVPKPTVISRRGFLQRGLAVGAGVAAVSLVEQSIARPAFSLARAGRPQLTHGVQSGDVTFNRAIVWARADRPSRLLVDVSTDASFRRFRRLRGPLTGSDQDFTAQLEVHGLPAGETVFYRAHFADPDQESLLSEAVAGRFRTAPTGRGDISFCWSGDTAGQGWGINPDFGGMRIYETMRTLSPDFFVHSGDTIYADGPILPAVALPDGGVWRNLTTTEKSKVAETLDEFRGNYRYNLMDDNVRRFNSEVPVFAQWDDHETVNNWYPGEILDDPRYQVKDVNVLAARAKQAFQDYQPIEMAQAEADRIYRKVSYGPSLEIFFLDLRSYRGPNTANDQTRRSPDTEILAERQLRWLNEPSADHGPPGRSSPPACPSGSSSATVPPPSRASPRVSPARWGGSSRSSTCCPSFGGSRCETWCGSPPTSTTRRLTTTTRLVSSSLTSTPSGSSSPGR